MASAPVKWQYYSETIDLKFNAGFVGASQDQKTLQISPLVGWYITLDKEGQGWGQEERMEELELFLSRTNFLLITCIEAANICISCDKS